jgi:hypothetical protein
MTEIRYGHEFGDGQLTGPGKDSVSVELFYGLLENRDYEGLSYLLGWAEGCPIVPTVLSRRSAQETASDYAELQFIRGTVLSLIEEHNPDLHSELTTTRPRREAEPAGQYFEEFIPEDHLENVRGGATVVGYDIPRLVREYIGPRAERSQERILESFEIFEEVLAKSTERAHSPAQFAVALANKYAELDNNPLKYVRRLLSAGKLVEDNQLTEYQEILAEMYLSRSELYTSYTELSRDERVERGIANISFPEYL